MIALWLGHEHVQTTQLYLHGDLTLKQRALDRTKPPATPAGRYQAPDTLIAFLGPFAGSDPARAVGITDTLPNAYERIKALAAIAGGWRAAIPSGRCRSPTTLPNASHRSEVLACVASYRNDSSRFIAVLRDQVRSLSVLLVAANAFLSVDTRDCSRAAEAVRRTVTEFAT
jgi:hypothetical protein